MSIVSSASSGSGRSTASSKRCRYFTARLPGPLASRTQPLRESRSSAPRIVRDLGAGLARAGAVRVDVLDVDVDERRTADRLRAPVVAARAAEEDRRAVADVHLRVCDLAVRAREAVLLPEAEGPCEPVE